MISYLSLLVALFAANGGTTESQAFSVAKAMRSEGCEAAHIIYLPSSRALPVCPGYSVESFMADSDDDSSQVAYWEQLGFDGTEGDDLWLPSFELDQVVP